MPAWGCLGPTGAILDRLRVILGPSSGYLAISLGPSSATWGYLGPSKAILDLFGATLGQHRNRNCDRNGDRNMQPRPLHDRSDFGWGAGDAPEAPVDPAPQGSVLDA